MTKTERGGVFCKWKGVHSESSEAGDLYDKTHIVVAHGMVNGTDSSFSSSTLIVDESIMT